MRHTACFAMLWIWVLMLSGCATTTAKAPAQNDNMTWGSRVETLSGVQDWDLNALIAIRNRADNNTATLRWQQKKQQYTLNLFGPMGTSAFRLSGTPGHVTLKNARGQTFYASSPEQLLAEQTGWQLPISNLYYWVRGLPVPGVPAQKQLDAYNHLVVLDQEGWKIQYLRYTSSQHIDLPSKIFISSQDLSVKIIISQWQI